jgi:hypothetical protein
MSLARHIAAEAKLRRERDEARAERDAGRLVVASQANKIRELDAAHRAALADLANLNRRHDAVVAELNAVISANNARSEAITYLDDPAQFFAEKMPQLALHGADEAKSDLSVYRWRERLHVEPDADRCG